MFEIRHKLIPSEKANENGDCTVDLYIRFDFSNNGSDCHFCSLRMEFGKGNVKLLFGNSQSPLSSL